MLINIYKLQRTSKGFTLVELVVVIAILAILSGLAIARSGLMDTTVKANTSRIAADLDILDNAITMYNTDHGVFPSDLSELSPYIAALPTPPVGRVYMGASGKVPVPDTKYDYDASLHRAILGSDNTSERFTFAK